jgi:hypothetical protein
MVDKIVLHSTACSPVICAATIPHGANKALDWTLPGPSAAQFRVAAFP